MGSIYLDYNASTPIDPAVAFGNPSSGHWASAPAKAALEKARGQVASLPETLRQAWRTGQKSARRQAADSNGDFSDLLCVLQSSGGSFGICFTHLSLRTTG